MDSTKPPATNANAISTQNSLSVAHATELIKGSGLRMDTIRESGIYTEKNRITLASLLNRKSYPSSWGEALVFTYYDATGTVVLRRVKPSNPPHDNKGKPRKYLQPSGVPVRLYVPPGVFDVLGDASTRLVITEGEKKALAATQAGFHCVGLSGVDCWHTAKKMSLLPDLDRITWKEREVFIAFDSDASDNENVDRAERQLAMALTNCGAKVRVIRIPPAENGNKQGVDDFLVAHGPAKFQQLLEQAIEPEPPDPGDMKGEAHEADPAVEAHGILASAIMGDLFRLRYWRGGWWWWSKGCYREKQAEEVRAQVVTAMNEDWIKVRSRIVSDVVDQLKAQAILASSVEPARWLGDDPAKLLGEDFHTWEAEECLATTKEIVHLPSLTTGREPSSIPATPAFFTTSAVEFAFASDAPRPEAWLAFMQDLWADDPQCIELLQEWFGYCLTNDTRQHKGLLLVGPPRGGKGTIGRIQTAIVGKGNIASPTLAGMGTNFGLWPLIGKSLAIISDARLSGRADQVAVVERILSITGEDSITIDRKNLQPITCRLPTRFLIQFRKPPAMLVSTQ